MARAFAPAISAGAHRYVGKLVGVSQDASPGPRGESGFAPVPVVLCLDAPFVQLGAEETAILPQRIADAFDRDLPLIVRRRWNHLLVGKADMPEQAPCYVIR